MTKTSVTKKKQEAKAKVRMQAFDAIIAGIRTMDNKDVMVAKKELHFAWNCLLATYCKLHSDKLGREVAQADVLRICGIKGEI
jgi:hypothetical protein